MSKPKRISVNAVEKIMKETHVPSNTFDWNGLEVFIIDTLSLNEMIQFVRDVSSGCFMEDTGEYAPEVRDFFTRSCVIEMYTNISLPSNVAKRYDILYRTDIYDFVSQHINWVQFGQMVQAIDKRIDSAVRANISGFTKQVSNLYSSLEDLEKKTEAIFSGMSGDDIKNIAQAFDSAEFSEEKLVEAYIKQTSKDEA